jgi:hypothetical protein
MDIRIKVFSCPKWTKAEPFAGKIPGGSMGNGRPGCLVDEPRMNGGRAEPALIASGGTRPRQVLFTGPDSAFP